MVTFRIGGVGRVRTAAGRVVDDGDAVSGGDVLGVDEDVFDDRAQHALAVFAGGVGGAGGVQPLVDLRLDQLRVGEQPGDVVPDDLVEVVRAHGLVGADPAAFVAVVVRAQAPVVVDLLVGSAGGGAVVAVPAARTRGQALQQRRHLAVAGRETLVVLQPPGHPINRLLADDGR